MDDEFKGHYEVFRSRNTKQWRWRLRSVNGKIVASSGEAYHNYDDCIHGIHLVRSTNSYTKLIRVKR